MTESTNFEQRVRRSIEASIAVKQLLLGNTEIVASMAKVLMEILWPWYRAQYGMSAPANMPEVSRVPLV